MERLKSFILELSMAVLVFFIVFIAGLVDIKAGEAPREEQRIKEINVVLEGDKKDIERLTIKIEKQHKELEEIKKQMEAFKGKENNEEWNNIVINYNSKLIQYNRDLSEYREKLDGYSKRYKNLKSEDRNSENVVEWVKSVLGV